MKVLLQILLSNACFNICLTFEQKVRLIMMACNEQKLKDMELVRKKIVVAKRCMLKQNLTL